MRLYNQLLTQSKDKFYLVIVLGILASSCIGSIAATLALRNLPDPLELIQLCIAVATAMWYNATILAQLSHKTMTNALILSVVANSIIIIIHLI
ncbi:MAG TPA: hypothetical protein VLZ11_03805 [Flavobacterium sp.]|nr:hypothetical protein [Flavobacterium sp.]